MNFHLVVKLLLEGLAVGLAAYLIPTNKLKMENIIAIALSSALIFFILDMFSPEVGLSVRHGAGFGLGVKQVGFGYNKEGFEDCKILCRTNPNNRKCSPNQACHKIQRGGKNMCNSEGLDVGTDVINRPVKFNSHCGDYYVDEKTESGACVLDTDEGDNLVDPYPLRTKPPPFSQTNVMGRKMNFNSSNCPVNSNTNEYKLVPGQYAKLVLQPGYNENVTEYEQPTLSFANWPTDNPLDLHYVTE